MGWILGSCRIQQCSPRTLTLLLTFPSANNKIKNQTQLNVKQINHQTKKKKAQLGSMVSWEMGTSKEISKCDSYLIFCVTRYNSRPEIENV